MLQDQARLLQGFPAKRKTKADDIELARRLINQDSLKRTSAEEQAAHAQVEGPWPLKSPGRHGRFLKSTCDMDFSDMKIKGRRQNSLRLTTNFSQNVTEPSKGISYSVSDLCRQFTKLTGPCVYTLHSNPIPQTDGTNGLLRLVAYISQTGHQCFPACFCHLTVWNFDVSP